jgi:hypothetical protein
MESARLMYPCQTLHDSTKKLISAKFFFLENPAIFFVGISKAIVQYTLETK